MKMSKLITSVLIFGLLSIPKVFALTSDTYREESDEMAQEEFPDLKGFRLGNSATLKAMITQEGQYDSNVFLSPDHRQHDYISITSPRFLLDLPLGMDQRHLLQFMYGADIGDFTTFKSQDYINQSGMAKANFTLPFGYLNIKNNFDDTNDRAETEFTSLVRRVDDLAQAVLGVEGNRLTYEAGFSHFLRQYAKAEFKNLNYTEDFISNTVYYRILPKTKALVEYDHSFIAYPHDVTRRGQYDQVRAGFKGDITERTNYTVKVGYQDRSYNGSAHTGYHGLVAEVGVNTAISENTTFFVNYIRTAVESIDVNNNYFNSDSVRVGMEHKIFNHLSVTASSELENREYPVADPVLNVKRHDKVLTDSVKLKYAIKEWCSISLGYQYLNNIANIDLNGYKDNIFSLSLDLKF